MSCAGNCGNCGNKNSLNDLNFSSNTKTRSYDLTGKKDDKESWMERTAARSMMRGVGFSDNDFEKPLIAVAAPHTNITPCNGHILELGQTVSNQLEKLGAKPYIFGTAVVTDGQAMGTAGMRYSLPSRDLIADNIEMMQEAYFCDGTITLSGCDKTIPASLMPIARNNLIGICLYGGSILPGHYADRDLNIVSTFEAVGEYSSGKIDFEEFTEIEKRAIPSCGSCGGMYTANTMASAIEAMGMSIPYSSSNPATDENGRVSSQKYVDCIKTAEALSVIMKKEIRARDIMTRKAFENAITVVMALGGSTNAVLHLLAIAREAEVNLEIDDFNKIGEKVPLIADMKPSGRYVMYDLFKVGGVPKVMKILLDEGLLHRDCLTVTGKTIAENLENIR